MEVNLFRTEAGKTNSCVLYTYSDHTYRKKTNLYVLSDISGFDNVCLSKFPECHLSDIIPERMSSPIQGIWLYINTE